MAAMAVAAIILSLEVVANSRSPKSFSPPSTSTSVQNNRSIPTTALRLPKCPPPATRHFPRTISVSTKSPDQPTFAHECYYAPAGQSLTIHFTNATTELSKAGISLSLIISRADDPAISPVKNRPGMFVGIMSKAVFVSRPAMAPATITMSVRDLPRGTYVMQLRGAPPTFVAVLQVN